jgi:hypothetical protein
MTSFFISFNFSSLSLFWIAWWMNEAICFVSSHFTPLVVMAGIQILSPDGSNGLRGSSGIVDFEVEIQTLSNTFSTSQPEYSSAEKSMIIM